MRTPRTGSIAWLADGYIYYNRYDLSNSDDVPRLWRMTEGEDAERYEIPGIDNCGPVRVGSLTSLPDGRLGMSRSCTDNGSVRRDYVALQPDSGEIEPLVEEVNDAALRPDMTSGYVSASDGRCAGVAPFTSGDGVGTFESEVKIGRRTWRLSDALHEPDGSDCGELGLAVSPHLLPDGRTLVFVAADALVEAGQEAIRMSTAEWFVCRWNDPDRENPIILTAGFESFRGMAVSPSLNSAVIAAERDGVLGLWLVDLGDGAVSELERGDFAAPAVSPTGDRVAVTDNSNGSRAVEIIDLR